ncbi:MAG: response regulator transcription factor [Myxococcaceae bacterium]|nr:response regulator transcription factor [Myxococcaceae bacterium]
MTIRVITVDDQPLYREGLATVLGTDPELEVVGEAGNGQEALELCARVRPDVVLMDLQMPVMDGVAATRSIKVKHPEARVLVLTTFDDDDHVFEALRAGAVGYLLKDSTGARLKEGVHAAARGESFLAPAIASKVLAELSRLRAQAPVGKVAESPFTEREAQVLALLVRGASNKEIGGALFISEGTVKNHVTAIFGKLKVQDRTQAALKARELGYA